METCWELHLHQIYKHQMKLRPEHLKCDSAAKTKYHTDKLSDSIWRAETNMAIKSVLHTKHTYMNTVCVRLYVYIVFVNAKHIAKSWLLRNHWYTHAHTHFSIYKCVLFGALSFVFYRVFVLRACARASRCCCWMFHEFIWFSVNRCTLLCCCCCLVPFVFAKNKFSTRFALKTAQCVCMCVCVCVFLRQWDRKYMSYICLRCSTIFPILNADFNVEKYNRNSICEKLIFASTPKIMFPIEIVSFRRNPLKQCDNWHSFEFGEKFFRKFPCNARTCIEIERDWAERNGSDTTLSFRLSDFNATYVTVLLYDAVN